MTRGGDGVVNRQEISWRFQVGELMVYIQIFLMMIMIVLEMGLFAQISKAICD